MAGNCGPQRVAWRAVRSRSAESSITSGVSLDASVLAHALEQLHHDIHPGDTMGESPSVLQNVDVSLNIIGTTLMHLFTRVTYSANSHGLYGLDVPA